MRIAMLVDASRCMGCRGCQAACKQWNQLPAEETTFTGSYENPPHFSSRTWLKVAFREHEDNGEVNWRMAKLGCMHCSDAACMQSCPTGAIYYTERRTVAIDYDKCIACNYCVANCPFNVMGLDRDLNVSRKCTFCYDRVTNGLKPACVTACTTDSLQYGEAEEILSIANRRVARLRAAGNPNAHVYGRDEVGGTGVLYVLEDSPEKYGLPAEPRVPLSVRFWNSVFRPARVLVLIAVAFGLWYNYSESKKLKP